MSTRRSNVEILLTAKDTGLTRALRRGRSELSGFSRTLRNATAPMASLVRGATSLKTSLLGLAGAAGGIYALNRALSTTLSLAMEQERSEAKLGAVLRATGEAAGYKLEQLKEMAAGLQGVTTVGDEVILNGMAILATFKQIKGDQFEQATQAALDLSAVLGTGLQTNITMIGRALEDPVRGLTSLTRAGVSFSEAQRDMIKQMVASGNIMGAQQVILDELKSQYGGAAEALRDTFEGALLAAQNALGDFKEEIGFTITQNQFFVEALNILETKFQEMGRFVAANRDEWMEWSKQTALAVLEFAARGVEGFDAVYRAMNFVAGSLRSTYALVLALGGGVQWFFELSNRAFGDTAKAKYWADQQVETMRLLDNATLAAQRNFEAVGSGTGWADELAVKIRELKNEMAKIEAKPLEKDLPEGARKTGEQLIQVGNTWKNVAGDIESVRPAIDIKVEAIDEAERKASELAAAMTSGAAEAKQAQEEAGSDTAKSWKAAAEESAQAWEQSAEKFESGWSRAIRAVLNDMRQLARVARGVTTGGASAGYATGGLVQALASGGSVRGWSPTPTADNIPAMLTAREFVQPVSAVDYYGPSFMEAVRRRAFPRDIALAGISGRLERLTASIPTGNRLAAGGMPAGGDSMTINLNFGGASIPVVSTRDNARRLAREFGRMQQRSSR